MFNHLDVGNAGEVTLEDALGYFAADKHPMVVTSRRKPEEVARDFQATFPTYAPDGVVTLPALEAFYQDVGFGVGDDDEFQMVLWNCWGLGAKRASYVLPVTLPHPSLPHTRPPHPRTNPVPHPRRTPLLCIPASVVGLGNEGGGGFEAREGTRDVGGGAWPLTCILLSNAFPPPPAPPLAASPSPRHPVGRLLTRACLVSWSA